MYVILLSTERTRIDVIKLSVYRDYIIVSIPSCQNKHWSQLRWYSTLIKNKHDDLCRFV